MVTFTFETNLRTNIEKEHTFKINHYAILIQDIEDVEVGCIGHDCIRIFETMTRNIMKSLDIIIKQGEDLTLSTSKLALLTSFIMFKCNDEPQLFDTKLIVVLQKLHVCEIIHFMSSLGYLYHNVTHLIMLYFSLDRPYIYLFFPLDYIYH